VIHHPWTSAHIAKYDNHGDMFSMRFVADMPNDVQRTGRKMAAIVAPTILQDRIVGSRADSIELKVGIAAFEYRCDPPLCCKVGK
jgi:hypothetical protein